MKHESTEATIKVNASDISFESIYEKPWFPTEEADEIKKANILIIPDEDDVDSNGVLFPETTSEFLEYLSRKSDGSEIICDIAVSEEDYFVIEKHSALINIATFLVTDIVLPFAVGLLTSYLYDVIKRHRRTPEETSTKVKVIVEETKSKKSMEIEYEGPVDGVKDALDNVSKGLFGKEND